VHLDWNTELRGQLDYHWQHQLRPRLDGLTDREYLWEPVPGAWSVRARGQSTAPVAAGAGDLVIDFAYRQPIPAPVTTIAWRIAHLVVAVFGMRVAGHFAGPPINYQSHTYAGTAAAALEQLDQGYAAWTEGVRGLGEPGLTEPCGPTEGPLADWPMAALVLHINREVLHHGAEITLLRDLYAATPCTGSDTDVPG